jgi:hypothetical protein
MKLASIILEVQNSPEHQLQRLKMVFSVQQILYYFHSNEVKLLFSKKDIGKLKEFFSIRNAPGMISAIYIECSDYEIEEHFLANDFVVDPLTEEGYTFVLIPEMGKVKTAAEDTISLFEKDYVANRIPTTLSA